MGYRKAETKKKNKSDGDIEERMGEDRERGERGGERVQKRQRDKDSCWNGRKRKVDIKRWH